MKTFLKKIEYSLIFFFVLLQSQIPFFLIQLIQRGGRRFSLGSTLLVLTVYLLILFYVLRMAKKEGLLTLDFSFFKWSSLGWLGLSYIMTLAVSSLGIMVMMLEGVNVQTTANQAALEELFQRMPVILIVVGAVISAPIVEEVAFRGLITLKLFPRHPIWGLVIGAILFGLFHNPTNIGSFVLYGGMGGVLALVFYLTERLEMSILAHMLRNGLAILLMLLMR